MMAQTVDNNGILLNDGSIKMENEQPSTSTKANFNSIIDNKAITDPDKKPVTDAKNISSSLAKGRPVGKWSSIDEFSKVSYPFIDLIQFQICPIYSLNFICGVNTPSLYRTILYIYIYMSSNPQVLINMVESYFLLFYILLLSFTKHLFLINTVLLHQNKQ